MKFGVILPSYMPTATVEGIRETALRAEALGYDSVWTTDHVMIGRDRQIPYGSIFEAISTLGWLAFVIATESPSQPNPAVIQTMCTSLTAGSFCVTRPYGTASVPI